MFEFKDYEQQVLVYHYDNEGVYTKSTVVQVPANVGLPAMCTSIGPPNYDKYVKQCHFKGGQWVLSDVPKEITPVPEKPDTPKTPEELKTAVMNRRQQRYSVEVDPLTNEGMLKRFEAEQLIAVGHVESGESIMIEADIAFSAALEARQAIQEALPLP